MSSHSEPIEAIIGRLYSAPVSRRGDRSDRLWWVCPFHDDRNPSLCVVPGASHYHCFGCGTHGDAIDFVRRLNPEMTFREAVRAIEGDPHRSPARPLRPLAPAVPRAESDRPEGWQEFAREIVAKAESTLWSDHSEEARSYLTRRGLREDSVRVARLGYRPADEWVDGIYPDRKVWIPRGIVIPWFDESDVVLINVRRPEGEPKYVAVRGSRRGGVFPGTSGIIAGKPVVIVEGEFDALLLGQELDGLAPVMTLGSAGNKPSARVKNALLGAFPWIVAGDADEAGEKSADGWLSRSDRCVRVAPPKGMGKDWTEAHENGLNLRDWWQGALARLDRQSRRAVPEGPSAAPQSTATGGEAVNPGVTDGLCALAPPRRPPREVVAGWLVEWRQRWGYLTEAHCSQGMPWREAEERAATQVEGELESAGFGPPPAFDYDPEAKFFRDWLRDLIENGQAARFLTKDQFSRAETLVGRESSDGEAMRSLVHDVKACYWEDRYRTLGLPNPADASRRWRCHNRYCLTKGRWWMSRYGVVRCMNCQPPGFPWLIIEEGDAAKAPIVERERSSQAIDYPCSIPVCTIRP